MPELENDGCTGFLEGWNGVDWRVCCDAHDWAYHSSRSWVDFLIANVDLVRCVAQQDIWAATVVMVGVFSPVAVILYWFGIKKQGTR